MSASDPTWLRALALPATFVVGALVTVQSSINGSLADQLGQGARAGILSALISFVTGLGLLLLLLLSLPSWRRDLARLRTATRAGRIRRWQLGGGLAGAALVATQGLTVSTIGVALFIVAVVAGQTTSALMVDHVGLGPAGRSAITVPRVLGAALAIVAVAVSSSGVLNAPGSRAVLLLGLLPLLAGAGTSVQQAINAQVAAVSSPWVATLQNFVVGTAALVVVLLLSFALPGRLDAWPTPPWLYTGGLLGVLFIASAAVFVRVVGVLVFGLTAVCGQVVSAVAIDLLTAPERVGPGTYAGAALTLIGVGVAAGSRRRTTRRTAPTERALTRRR